MVSNRGLQLRVTSTLHTIVTSIIARHIITASVHWTSRSLDRGGEHYTPSGHYSGDYQIHYLSQHSGDYQNHYLSQHSGDYTTGYPITT